MKQDLLSVGRTVPLADPRLGRRKRDWAVGVVLDDQYPSGEGRLAGMG